MKKISYFLALIVLVAVSCSKEGPQAADESLLSETTKTAGAQAEIPSAEGLWRPNSFVGYQTEEGGFELDVQSVELDSPAYAPLYLRSYFQVGEGSVTRYGVGVVLYKNAADVYDRTEYYYFKTAVCRETGDPYYLDVDAATGKVRTNITPFGARVFDIRKGAEGEGPVLCCPAGRKNSAGADLYYVVELTKVKTSTQFVDLAIAREEPEFMARREAYLDASVHEAADTETRTWWRSHLEEDFDKEF